MLSASIEIGAHPERITVAYALALHGLKRGCGLSLALIAGSALIAGALRVITDPVGLANHQGRPERESFFTDEVVDGQEF